MTPDQILILVLLVATVLLFVTEKLRADVVALLVLATLLVTGLVDIDEALSGFASPAVVTVWAVFIISGGITRSGLADRLAGFVLHLAGRSEVRLILLLMLTAGFMSAFMNNIGAVAILMPAVIAIGRELRIPVSKLLMPLAFAALLGGNMTLIGTPPNILATDLLARISGVAPFRFFDFFPMGILVLLTGILYMLLIGRHLLPDRGGVNDDLSTRYHLRDHLARLRVGTSSPLIGENIVESDFGQKYGLNVLYVRSGDAERVGPMRGYPLSAGDVLLVEGSEAQISTASAENQLHSTEDWTPAQWALPLEEDDLHAGEVSLPAGSGLVRQTLRSAAFRNRFGLSVVALRRNGVAVTEQLAEVPLQAGDTLLVQGSQERLDALANNNDLVFLEPAPATQRRLGKGPLSALILAGVILTSAFNILPVAGAMLIGALLMVLSGVLEMDEAYGAIDWKAVFLIAGMLPLGVALENTGTARLLAEGLVDVVGGRSPLIVLGTLFVMTALLTEVISNAAAAVLLVPIAIDVALGLGVRPEPFVMATVIAASTSFLLPVGHQVNVVILGAGDYRMTDFTRVGIGLNILLLLLTVGVLPLIWPL